MMTRSKFSRVTKLLIISGMNNVNCNYRSNLELRKMSSKAFILRKERGSMYIVMITIPSVNLMVFLPKLISPMSSSRYKNLSSISLMKMKIKVKVIF